MLSSAPISMSIPLEVGGISPPQPHCQSCLCFRRVRPSHRQTHLAPLWGSIQRSLQGIERNQCVKGFARVPRRRPASELPAPQIVAPSLLPANTLPLLTKHAPSISSFEHCPADFGHERRNARNLEGCHRL